MSVHPRRRKYLNGGDGSLPLLIAIPIPRRLVPLSDRSAAAMTDPIESASGESVRYLEPLSAFFAFKPCHSTL